MACSAKKSPKKFVFRIRNNDYIDAPDKNTFKIGRQNTNTNKTLHIYKIFFQIHK